MRPVNIVILVLAGALGGAAVMRVVALRHEGAENQVQAYPAAPSPVAAIDPAPAATPVPAAPPAPLELTAADSAAQPAPVLAPSPAPRRPARAAPAAARVWHEARPSPFYPRTVAAQEPPAHVVVWARPSDPPPAVAADSTSQTTPAPAANPEPVAPATEPAPPPALSPAAPPDPPAPENPTPVPVPPERTPNTVTLNAGLLISVRLLDGLSSGRNAPGDAFVATLDRELVVDGFVIAERGARVEGRVVASNPGKLGNAAAMAVELTRLNTSDGQQVAIHTDSFEKHAEPNRNADVETIAGGAVLGAVIGGMVGGGKGAAIGAGAGAGAGGVGVAVSRTRPATLPTETRITFRLRTPVTLTERLGG